MTAPKCNSARPKLRSLPFSGPKISQKCRPTSSNFGCFESLIFTKFLASQDRFLFFQFFHLCSMEVIFFQFPPPSARPTCPTFARRLPDVPCPTFRARRARRLPDVCPTSPDVCPTFARRFPVIQKNPRAWHSHFLQNLGTSRKWRCVLFFFEKKTPPPKKT